MEANKVETTNYSYRLRWSDVTADLKGNSSALFRLILSTQEQNW